MEIILRDNAGYIGLRNVKFPVIVDAHRVGYDNIAYVSMLTLLSVPGFEWVSCDATEGGDYTFLKEDYQRVDEVERTFLSEQKERLLQLVLDYGIAINDACYESECGTMKGMEECEAEAERLWGEIKSLVNTL